MKLRIAVLASVLATLSLFSCSREDRGGVAGQEGSPCTVTLTVGEDTRAGIADTEGEARVADLKVFVFNSGRLDGYGSASDSRTVMFTASVGVRTVYAVVNGPDTLAKVTTQAQLESALSDFLQDNAGTADRFVMVGRRDVTLATDNSIIVSVGRIVSRIRFGSVVRSFAADSWASLPASRVLLSRVFVTNAAGSAGYEVSGNPEEYVVREPGSWCSSEINSPASIVKSALLYSDCGGAPLAQEGSAEPGCRFYVYPNPTETDMVYGGKYRAKVTRVVVELKADFGDGQWHYFTYPLLLGPIGANTDYLIEELVVTRPGNPSDGDDEIDRGEDDEVATTAASFRVSTRPWDLEMVTYGSDTPGKVIL